jgi:tetratricopeptide (TPR) repeat protein
MARWRPVLIALAISLLAPLPARAQDEASVSQMLDELGRVTSAPAANRIAQRIWHGWGRSGSATIDLLMQWAADAMRANRNPAAEDLLTQVVVLAPAYAEGWNRRATLYFQMSDYSRSIADIERTLQLEPRHFGALTGLAVILQRTGLERKSLAVWYRVLAVYPANEAAQKAVTELEEKLAGEGA